MTNDFFAATDGSDLDQHWDQETGRPTISHFSGAVQVFAVQNHPCSVHTAAAAFKVDPAVIVEVVEFHPWMYVDGPHGDFNKMMIEHEGE